MTTDPNAPPENQVGPAPESEAREPETAAADPVSVAEAQEPAPEESAASNEEPAAALEEAPASDEEPESAPDLLAPSNGESSESRLSAAEREYQEAMRAAKALGLDLAPEKDAEVEAAAAAEQAVQRLGLDQPVEAKEPEPPPLFAEPEPEPEAEDEETDDLLGPEVADGRAWYVLNTYSGHENRVQTNLERRIASMDVSERIFRVVVPTEEELEIRGGQRRHVQRKLLPGYVLVEMILDDDTWYVVRNTPGVTGFVGAEKPHPLPRDEVKSILKQMRVAEPRVRVGFEINDAIRVMDGPFQDFIGQVDEINIDKGKVRVLISMFGRETPVELDFMQVEKV